MPETLTTPELLYLRPDQLEPWPGLNPRKHFSEERIREIAASIAAHGVLQNLVVTEIEPGRHYIVAGETRWRAARLAEEGCGEIGLDPKEVLLPCRAVALVEGEALAIAMLENIQRQSLTAVEEARGFARLLELNPRWTQAKVAEEILGDHRRQPYVANRLRLLELPGAVLDLIQEGHVQHSQARDYLLPLLQLEDRQPQLVLERVVARINAEVLAGGKVQGPWLEEVVGAIRTAVIREYGNPSLFGDEEPAPVVAPTEIVPPKAEATPSEMPPVEPVAASAAESPDSSPIDRHIERAHRLLGHDEASSETVSGLDRETAAPARTIQCVEDVARIRFAAVLEAAGLFREHLDFLLDLLEAEPGLKLSGGERKLLADLDYASHGMRGLTDTRCRVCGCTDSEACEGGCAWVETSGDGWGVCSTPACAATLVAQEAEAPPIGARVEWRVDGRVHTGYVRECFDRADGNGYASCVLGAQPGTSMGVPLGKLKVLAPPPEPLSSRVGAKEINAAFIDWFRTRGPYASGYGEDGKPKQGSGTRDMEGHYRHAWREAVQWTEAGLPRPANAGMGRAEAWDWRMEQHRELTMEMVHG